MRFVTKRDIWVGVALVAAVAALGLWPHLRFSYAVDELAFFKNAYDEDTYTLHPLGFGGVRLDRLVGASVLHLLLFVSGGSYDFALIAMDALLPALAAASAFVLGAVIFRHTAPRLLFALTLLFSSDLFTLGNVATPLASFFSIGMLRDYFFGSDGLTFVPYVETSYLNLFRSPEPQTSYAIAFLFLALLLHAIKVPMQPLGWKRAAGFIVLQVLLTGCYAIVSYPLIALEGYAAVILAFCGAWRRAAFISGLAAASALSIPLAARILTGEGSSFVFASHLPMFSVGVIMSLALTVLVIAALAGRGFRDRILWLALGFAGLPFALMNQQLITGLMISTKEWERYINTQSGVIAAALLFSRMLPAAFEARTMRFAAISVSALICWFAPYTSMLSYKLWLPLNLQSLAVTRAIEQLQPRPDLIVLQGPGLAPLVDLRLGGDSRFLLDYTSVFATPVPSLASSPFALSNTATALFEHWRIQGASPDEIRTLLDTEANQRTGYFSGFLFNVCDYWFPCTDNRGVRTQEIKPLLPSVVAAYERYLANGPADVPAKTRVYVGLSSNPGKALRFFDQEPIAHGVAAGVEAFAFAGR